MLYTKNQVHSEFFSGKMGMTWRRYWCTDISVSRAFLLTPFRMDYCLCKARSTEQANKAFPQRDGGISLKEAFVIFEEILRLAPGTRSKVNLCGTKQNMTQLII